MKMEITDDDHDDHPVKRLITTFFETGESAYLAPGGVGRDRGDVLDTPDAHASASESTEGALCTGAGGLGASTTGCTELDVEGSDADLAAARGNVLSSQHSGVRGRLVTISLHFHATYSRSSCS